MLDILAMLCKQVVTIECGSAAPEHCNRSGPQLPPHDCPGIDTAGQ
jgi:hypothetical protein